MKDDGPGVIVRSWMPWRKDTVAETTTIIRCTPRPRAEVVRGAYNNPDIGSSDFSNDSAAAYTHALQWCLTGNDAHARKAIDLLNAWSATLKTVSGHDTKLLIGMEGVDLYGASSNRLAAGFEYTANYNLGHDVPYEPYLSFEGDVLSFL